jgi:UDP-N-acetylmuramate dehydrogenase
MQNLKNYHTFGIDAQAKNIIALHSLNTLLEELPKTEKPFLCLGQGSNVLFCKDFLGTVFVNQIKGISIVEETQDTVWVKAQSGEIWHDFVMHCVEKGWAGLENLALIPGTVGAAPMQNIGAYGVELKDSLAQVEALNLDTLEIELFDNRLCAFAYRDSFFKQNSGKYFIVSVTFTLQKTQKAQHYYYRALQSYLHEQNITNPSIQEVANAVIAIRQSKLPDPKKIGNAGSFFKNPIVSKSHYKQLQKTYPNMPCFEVEQLERIKVPAAFLIETLGYKGKTIDGRYGVHAQQALVLVNYKNATGAEIYALSQEIIQAVKKAFQIDLEREINVL